MERGLWYGSMTSESRRIATASSVTYRSPARTSPATSVVFPDSIGAGNSAASPPAVAAADPWRKR